MRSKSGPQSSVEAHVREIRRATRKKHSAEERIRIVLTGLRGSAKFYPTGAEVACAAKLSPDQESGYGHSRRISTGAVLGKSTACGGLESNRQPRAVMVRYMESYGRSLMPAVAERYGQRRSRLPQLRVGSVDRRNIP